MSDILSVCVQDILYGRKSKLRAKISSCAEVISSGVKSAAYSWCYHRKGLVSLSEIFYHRIISRAKLSRKGLLKIDGIDSSI